MFLTHLFLAEGVPTVSDPASTIMTTLGGGAGAVFVVVLWQNFVKPLVEVLTTNLKNRLGDSELKAKTQTRAMIQGVHESIAEIAKDQRATAEVLRDVAKELIEFRRENDKAHEQIIRGQS